MVVLFVINLEIMKHESVYCDFSECTIYRGSYLLTY